MKLVRPALAVAVGAGLILSGTAGAATAKPVCNIVKDASADADIVGGAGQDDSMDIVSADIATDKKFLTGVIRVVKASPTSSVWAYGSTWRIDFTVDGVDLSISAVSDRDGVVGQYTYTDTTGGHIIASDGAVTVDTGKNEIRISVPVTAYGEHATFKVGKTMITGISATTGAIANTPAGNLRFPTVDSSDTTDGSYKAGTKSCVVPGK